MEWIFENKASIFNILTAVIAAASAIAIVTPSEADNKIVAKLRSIINFLALNFGNAAPKASEAPKATEEASSGPSGPQG